MTSQAPVRPRVSAGVCVSRALEESVCTIMQPIVHITRLPSVCSLGESFGQAVNKVLDGIIDPGLHLQEVAY